MLMRSATLAYFAIFAHANEDGISCSGGQCAHEGEGDDVGLLSVRTASNFGPLPPAPTPAQPQLCDPSLPPITKPDDYKNAWLAQGDTGSNKDLPACVAENLFGCFYACKGDRFYPDAAEKAWISPNENLMQYLYLQHLYGADDPQKVAAGAFIIVGYGPPGLAYDQTGQCLGVFTLPAPAIAAPLGITPMVPTVNYWFSFMAEADFKFDWSVQKGLALAYSQLGVGGTTNVLDVFQGLTHCSAEVIAHGDFPDPGPITPDNHTSCNESVVDVYNTLQDYAQQGTACVKVFHDNVDNKWSLTNLGDVRMMLWRCFDANPWNTFVGLGWNNYPNPLVCVKPKKQTNIEHYTGAEFVINNIRVGKGKAINPVKIELTDYTASDNEELFTKGFC